MLICKADTNYHTRIGLIIFKNVPKDNKKHKKMGLLMNKKIIHIIRKRTIEKSLTAMMSSSAYTRLMTIVTLWTAI